MGKRKYDPENKLSPEEYKRLWHKLYAREYRQTAKNKAYTEKYYKEYADKNREVRLEYLHRWWQTPTGAKHLKRIIVKEKEAYNRSHGIVKRALQRGELRKGACEICGSERMVQAHHCDYNKPLDVMWLCKKCHTEWHKNNTPIYLMGEET